MLASLQNEYAIQPASFSLADKNNALLESMNELGHRSFRADPNFQNKKIAILPSQFPDSVFTFPQQQELAYNYLDSASVFKILFQNKVYLISKKGKQLTTGFDNIYEYHNSNFYVLEKYTLVDGETVRIQGLASDEGKTVASCKYKHITLNSEDSSIYCCSAVYNNRLNDDVYDYSGKLIYVNKKHIEFSSKKTHIYRVYEPKELFVIENENSKDLLNIEGEKFKYLKNNKGIIKQGNNLYLLDILTGKKTKIDKSLYLVNLYTTFE